MQSVSGHTAGYLLGAGHGRPLDSLDPNGRFDCSSSTSYVLRKADMFPREYAMVSGDFRNWGEPGKGSYFTVYYNAGHVWIRLHRSRWWRFDTSPQGDPRSPKSGPRLRYVPRFTTSFGARHWKGM
jgi:hypothetical protein